VAVVASILAGCGVGLFKAEAESAFDSKVRKKVALQLGCNLCGLGKNKRKGLAMTVAGTIFCRRIIG
jgi:hypothetical protein